MSTWNLGQNDPPEGMQIMKDQLASKETQIASYQSQLMKKANELEELKSALNDALHKLSHESGRALKFETDLIQRSDDLRNEKNALQNMEAAFSAAQEKSRVAELEAEELQAALYTLSHTSNTRQERSLQLEREKATLQARIRDLENQLSHPPNAVSKVNVINRPRSSSLSNFRITTLEADLNDLRAALQQKEKDLEDTTKKLSAAHSEAMRIGNEKHATEKRLTSRISELEASLAEKDQELRYLGDQEGETHREEELLQRIEEDDAKIAALESILRGVQDVDVLQKKLAAAESQFEEGERKMQQVIDQHSQLKDEKTLLLSELRMAQDRIRALELDTRGSLEGAATVFFNRSFKGQPPLEDPMKDTLPLGNESMVEYVGRLLSAIDRLRDERDCLRRDVQFLESESRFAIEALEAKLSASVAVSSGSDETSKTLGQMKKEMDLLHSELSEVKAQCSADISHKNQEIRRLGKMVIASGLVVGHLGSRIEPLDGGAEEKDAKLKDLGDRLEVTVLCLEATTSQRDDVVDTLRQKEDSWEQEIQAIRLAQQEGARTIQDLASEVDDLTKQLEQVDSERGSLALQVTNLQADLQAAQDELAKAESRYSSLQFHQLSSMSSNEQTKALRAQIEELEMRVLRRTEQVGIHQHDIRRLETNLRLQEDRLNEMTMEMEMLIAQKEAMVEDCANTREERDNVLQRVEDLEDEMERLEGTNGRNEEAATVLLGVMIEAVGNAKDAIRPSATSLTQATAEDRLQNALLLADQLKEEKVRVEHDIEVYQQRIDELDEQVEALERSRDGALTRATQLEADLALQCSKFQAQIDELQLSKQALQQSHTSVVAQLESDLSQLQCHVAEIEGSSSHQVQELAFAQENREGEMKELESRLASLTNELAEKHTQFDKLQEQHQEELSKTTKAKELLESQLADLHSQIEGAERRYEDEKANLCLEVEKQRESNRQLEEDHHILKVKNHKLCTEQEAASRALAVLRHDLELQQTGFQQANSDHAQQLEHLSKQIHELTSDLQKQQDLRTQDEVVHRAALKASEEQCERYGTSVRNLQSDLVQLRDEVASLKALRLASEQEKSCLQEQVTSFVAKIEQNKSMRRLLEKQLEQSELSAASFRSELARVQAELAKIEQANAKTGLNLSLTTAQHKREMAELERALQSLQSKSHLDQVVAELEERNREMEDLLKQKCSEIEENDDRALEMLKENKKLSSKVESMTRKVQTLQTKLAALKVSSSPATTTNSKFETAVVVQDMSSTVPVPPVRQRSTTLSSTHISSVPSNSRSSSTGIRTLQRVASGPALPLKPKTPEKRIPPVPVFRNPTPERTQPERSPVDGNSSVIGKKRRAPDDFEACESVPLQAFTAESLPQEDHENRTPRVRRVLSSLQSGFTPIRNSVRPIMPMPSPRRNHVTPQTPPCIADVTNSPLVVPPLNPSTQSAKSSKRSWLGKIRGVSTQGMSRP